MKELPRQSDKDRAAYAFGDAGDYRLGPDSVAQANVPKGVLTKHWLAGSTVYPGVAHDYWIHVPQTAQPREPLALMIFLDGTSFLDERVNATAVLENLACQAHIPPTLGVFLNPGTTGPGLPLWGGSDNRSLEYDSTSDAFVRFLLHDLLPPIESQWNITSNPDLRGIAGISSGGAAAFTAAWQRPEAFRLVMSFVGSFVDIRGANAYPAMIRKAERKPLRVFLQSGTRDLDVVFGSWPIANQDMAAALRYRDYDHQFVFGEGGHSMKHGAAVLPDALRWLYRGRRATL